jgi:hypothetical protein
VEIQNVLIWWLVAVGLVIASLPLALVVLFHTVKVLSYAYHQGRQNFERDSKHLGGRNGFKKSREEAGKENGVSP